jgi:hypothetical protein
MKKILNCSICLKFVGEMEKGKILKKSVIYCEECNKTINDMLNNTYNSFPNIFEQFQRKITKYDKR